MSARTSIQWTDRTWNPTRGCSRVSAGCDNCYAMRQAHRYDYPAGPYEGLTRVGKHGVDWSGRVRLVPEVLDEPLRWRKPQRIFVNSMSDLFHEALPFHDIARVFDVFERAPRHTFQVLTKRPRRMLEFCEWADENGLRPQRNVWLGVSVENQATADERIPLLRQTPAAVRFVSLEPLLEQVDLCLTPGSEVSGLDGARRGIHWCITGGESGPKARPFDVAWARSVIEQCREAGVACFVKQLGAQPYSSDERDRAHYSGEDHRLNKGGDPSEWPEDLRVREFPG